MSIILQGIACLIPSLLFATGYAVGGRDKAPLVRPRIWRRVIAPLLLSLGLTLTFVIVKGYSINAICHILSSFITYFLAMTLTKYGGDTLWQKVRGRIWSGFVVGIASLPLALTAQSWRLFALQVILAISAHLALGIRNILPAHLEEFLISLITVCLVGGMLLV